MLEQLPRGQAERLQFIEDMLFWVGRVGNADLRQRFDVAKSLAAQDIAKYRQMQAVSILYEPQLKSFVAPDPFEPMFSRQSLERFVNLVQSDQLAGGDIVDIAFLYPPPRPAPVNIARAVINALMAEQEIEVEYVSFSSGTTRRWLTPHALAGDGLRVHVRAYDHSKNRFADFVMGRIQRVLGRRRRTIDPDLDADWFHVLPLELVANPNLPKDRRDAVMNEFEFQGDVLIHPVRRAMLIYLNTRMLLHSELANMPKSEFYRPLVPRDQEAFDRLLSEVLSGAG